MCGYDPDLDLQALRTLRAGARRGHARIRVELTEREIRAVIRATTLVADVLRPELVRYNGAPAESPLVTAYQALIAACERHGVDLGLGSSSAHGD